MENKNDIFLFTTQRTLISPSLLYSVKILEMNNLDLGDHIRDCANDNPFLEAEWPVNNSFFSDNNSQFLENIPKEQTLPDKIYAQLPFLKLNAEETEITAILLDGISENGYLNSDLLKYVSNEKNVSYFEVLRLIKKLQKLSPPGLFTFNLKDKIKLILEAENKYNKNYAILVENLENIAKCGPDYLLDKYKIAPKLLSDMIAEIGHCGAKFTTENEWRDTMDNVPDMVISRQTTTNFNLFVNDELLPQVSANAKLFAEISEKRCSQSDKKYMNDNFSSAELLVKAINYRNTTLVKILKEIAHRQQDFFNCRDSYLYPVSVRSIADALTMHESTVHRAIAGKTVATPRGVFSIKHLLPKEIKSKNYSSVVSDYSIKEYMKVLINNEPIDSPYSDNHIVGFLNSRGINISRRTVAKYRSALEIPTASQRVKLRRLRRNIS
ncbi:MAG: RNA polymerase factor sigma-54 [Holosporaceae bacterium]|jgi:RNA polymerase sigma-54 factor|nr:RNA polymerase factor sigma-54 [Holosporaceae bacterium]